MIECVRCGHPNDPGTAACSICTWPFSMEAWKSTEFVIRRVTIDTGCINQLQRDEALNTLEHWERERLIALQRSDALIAELKGDLRIKKAESIEILPSPFVLGLSALNGPDVLAGPDMEEPLARIMFPTTIKLTNNQNYDIEHLRAHVLTGGDAFVTNNPNDFLVRGKKDSLSTLGIWAFQPADLVSLLRDLYRLE